MKEFDYSDENIKNTILYDYFSRKNYLLSMIDIINTSNEGKVIAVDAPWGSGKTVFIKQFLYLLKDKDLYSDIRKEENPALEEIDKIFGFYFNAWENDLVRNPTVNILKSILKHNGPNLLEYQQKGEEIFKTISNIALKFSSVGIIGFDDIVRNKPVYYNEEYENLKEISDAFSKAIDLIKSVEKSEKIVIVIDELDRCRPSYAVELLETLKHFYNDNDIIFIITTDLTQLSHTVKKLYGQSFNSDLYLQRFFDGILTLNVPNYERYIDRTLGISISQTNVIYEVCKVAINYYNMSPREINKFIKQVKLKEDIISKDVDFYYNYKVAKFLFIPWAFALKSINVTKFQEFRKGCIGYQDFKEFLSTNEFLAKWLLQCWKKTAYSESTENAIDELYNLYIEIFSNNSLKMYRESASVNRDYEIPYKDYFLALIDF